MLVAELPSDNFHLADNKQQPKPTVSTNPAQQISSRFWDFQEKFKANSGRFHGHLFSTELNIH